MKREHVKLQGMKGTWYVIDAHQVSGGTTFYLWESEQYGDGYPCVLTDDNLTIYDECCYSGIRDALMLNVWHL